MPPNDQLNRMQSEFSAMKTEQAVMREQYTQLIMATKDNTTAINLLTNTLSYNKGAVMAAFKTASIGTAGIGALGVFFAWILGFLHIGPK